MSAGPLRRLRGAHLPLALFSFACTVGLLLAEFVDANAVGGPIGIALAALFALNGSARLWVWRHVLRRR